MDLSNIPSIKSRKPKKRVGHGIGSGKGGHTSGRGAKGQKVRGAVAAHFEGGQNPFYKRIPKVRGFKSGNGVLEVRADQLSRFPDGETVNKTTLVRVFGKKSFKYSSVKIVKGSEKINNKINYSGVTFSKSVREAIIASGGTISK
jgi:large subunit ribosomal protein L15